MIPSRLERRVRSQRPIFCPGNVGTEAPRVPGSRTRAGRALPFRPKEARKGRPLEGAFQSARFEPQKKKIFRYTITKNLQEFAGKIILFGLEE